MSDETPADRNPSLEAFVEAIEVSLRTRRGVDHVLSPREFALARAWYDAGVALATVLVAIDLTFDAEPSISSLAFCRRRVEQLAAGTTRGGTPSRRESGHPNLPELAERLDALRSSLQDLPPRAAALPLLALLLLCGYGAVSAGLASFPVWGRGGPQVRSGWSPTSRHRSTSPVSMRSWWALCPAPRNQPLDRGSDDPGPFSLVRGRLRELRFDAMSVTGAS